MRTALLSVLLAVSPCAVMGQSEPVPAAAVATGQAGQACIVFGYLSYADAMRQLPEYEAAQNKIRELRDNYRKEMDRSQEEFNIKYEEFLSEQQSLMPSIRRKRQVELEDMLNGNKDFRKEALRLLAQAEEEALRPVRQTLNALIATTARELHLAFVINTDGDACPYIDPDMGIDISQTVVNRLK